MKKITHNKYVKISLNVLFYSIIVGLMLFAFANMKIKKENNIANIFGYGFLSVQSNSMYGDLDDSFEKGDMIFVKMLDEQSTTNLQVGDIVTYYDMSIRAFNTHRIVEINLEDDYLVTQADYNPVTSQVNNQPDQPIALDQVISVYKSDISKLGLALDYMQSPTGFALTVILPVIVILIFEGFVLFRNIMLVNKEKIENKYKSDLEKTHELLEIEKDKMRQELLKELKQQENK